MIQTKAAHAHAIAEKNSSNAFLPDGPFVQGASTGPLHGFTFAAKDLYDVRTSPSKLYNRAQFLTYCRNCMQGQPSNALHPMSSEDFLNLLKGHGHACR
jgi:hypothetical protein